MTDESRRATRRDDRVPPGRREGSNVDAETVAGFGDEWRRFDQTRLDPLEKEAIFKGYFGVFPWDILPDGGGTGADIGCGSGRWATIVAPRVSLLHCVDASSAALRSAEANLASFGNVRIHRAAIDRLPFADESLDFAYSLGVLHHVPDTLAAIRSIAKTLRKGAPFLVYIYYAFDSRPRWYRRLWNVAEAARFAISRLPHPLRYVVSQLLAALVYWPLARTAGILGKRGCLPAAWPLSYYRDKSFYVMRTDALDRFGTRLEKRFTKSEIETMLRSAGFDGIRFSDMPPYWCAVGVKS